MRVGGEADFAGFVLCADFGDAVALGIEADFEAVDFDEQHRLGIERKAELERLLDGDQDALVHHFERGRDDARADDVADRLRRVVDRIEHGEHRADALRIAREPDPDLGDDAERAFAADDRADQVGPGRILGRSAESDDFAVGGDHFQAEHVIDRDAVFERVRAAGVGGRVAADRAGALAGWIGGVVIAGAGQMLVERGVHDAGLDDGIAVAEIDFENLLHPREHDHHAAADRHAAAGQARAGPARHERHGVLVAQPHDGGDFGGRSAETRPRSGSASR